MADKVPEILESANDSMVQERELKHYLHLEQLSYLVRKARSQKPFSDADLTMRILTYSIAYITTIASRSYSKTLLSVVSSCYDLISAVLLCYFLADNQFGSLPYISTI